MSDFKAELLARLKSIQIGGEVIIYNDGTEAAVERKAKRAINRGKVIVRKGVRTWINHYAVLDPDKSGSYAYQWNDDGERVRIHRVHVTVDRDGVRTEKKLPDSWRKYEEV